MANDIWEALSTPRMQLKPFDSLFILQKKPFHNCNFYMQGFQIWLKYTGLSIHISDISQPVL